MTIINSLIPNFTTGNFEVIRPTEGFFRKGRYVRGEDGKVTIKGSLQPMTAREIKQSTEGERLKDIYKFYSNEPLLTIDTTRLSDADRVIINGETYRVLGVEEWFNTSGFSGIRLPHFKATLVRDPQQ